MSLDVKKLSYITSGLGLITTAIAFGGAVLFKEALLVASAALVGVVAINVFASLGAVFLFATVASVSYCEIQNLEKGVDFFKAFTISLFPVALIIGSIYAVALSAGAGILVVFGNVCAASFSWILLFSFHWYPALLCTILLRGI